MKRIIVIGCPGSGKSTFSSALHSKIGIPLYHLDMMYWNKDKTVVEKSVFLDRLSSVLEREEWIIDGNYVSTMDMRMAICDTVIFLDYPPKVCLDGIKERCGRPRSDMPWIETDPDPEFIEYIKSFNESVRPQMLELLKKHNGKNVIVFKKRDDAYSFLQKLNLSL